MSVMTWLFFFMSGEEKKMDYSKIKSAAQELLDIQSIKECQDDLLERIIEQLTAKLDICTGFPIVGLFTTLHKVGQSFFDYKMCMRLLKFYEGCKDMDVDKKIEFWEKNVNGKESEVGYKILQLLDRLDADEKALLVGKLYEYCANKGYDISSYFRICKIVENCFYEDLQYLKYWKEKDSICSKNKLIPQEIIDSLYNADLLAEDGFDGGGFTEDSEAGIIFTLNTYSKILLEII